MDTEGGRATGKLLRAEGRWLRRLALVAAPVAVGAVLTAAPGQTAGSADLIVESVTVSTAAAPPGGDIAVNQTTRNVGDAFARNTLTRVYVSRDTIPSRDERLQAFVNVPRLEAQSAHTSSGPWRTPVVAPGHYHLIACADDTLILTEANEQNNCAVADSVLEVLPLRRDPRVSSISAHVEARKGDALDKDVVTAGASGAGAFPVPLNSSPFHDTGYFFLSGDRTTDATDFRLPPRLSDGTIVLPRSAPAGVYYLGYCLIPDPRFVDDNERNNCLIAENATAIGAWPPDVSVTAVADPPATAPAATAISVTETTKNVGSVSAPASSTGFWLSADRVLDRPGDHPLTGSRSVPQLAAGVASTATTSVVLSVPAGRYWLFACSDEPRTLHEQIESNNCRGAGTPIDIT